MTKHGRKTESMSVNDEENSSCHTPGEHSAYKHVTACLAYRNSITYENTNRRAKAMQAKMCILLCKNIFIKRKMTFVSMCPIMICFDVLCISDRYSGYLIYSTVTISLVKLLLVIISQLRNEPHFLPTFQSHRSEQAGLTYDP